MASIKSCSTSAIQSYKSLTHRSDLPGKLQRVATGIFVTGFAASVAASRILPPAINQLQGQGNGADNTQFPTTTNNTNNANDSNAKVHLAMNLSRQLLQDLIHTIDEARIDGKVIEQESMKRARNIARSLASIDNICRTNALNDIKLLGAGTCAAPAQAALVHLSTGQDSLSSGIVIKIQGIGGIQQFTFASGTTQANILNAINAFSKTLGIEAEQSMENSARVEIRSVEIGADARVRMWGNPVIFSDAIGGAPLTDLKDYGTNAITLQAIRDDP